MIVQLLGRCRHVNPSLAVYFNLKGATLLLSLSFNARQYFETKSITHGSKMLIIELDSETILSIIECPVKHQCCCYNGDQCPLRIILIRCKSNYSSYRWSLGNITVMRLHKGWLMYQTYYKTVKNVYKWYFLLSKSLNFNWMTVNSTLFTAGFRFNPLAISLWAWVPRKKDNTK